MISPGVAALAYFATVGADRPRMRATAVFGWPGREAVDLGVPGPGPLGQAGLAGRGLLFLACPLLWVLPLFRPAGLVLLFLLAVVLLAVPRQFGLPVPALVRAQAAGAVRGGGLVCLLAQVVQQVPAVGNLDRVRRPGPGAVGVVGPGPGR